MRAVLERVQNELFDLGADLSVPMERDARLRVTQQQVDALELDCDRFNAELPELKSFVLPGGSEAAARLHVARTICRRAEREAITAAGVYNVSLKVTDNGGLFGTASAVGDLTAMVVVYDPSAGFVTGGGWINSPAGAYPANPTLVGKANFGFVSKYKKGATVPTGETEFVFSVAGMSFHASVYEWLVISGAKAQYKGSGTINGAGDYRFMLTATDGHVSGGGGVDKLRMKIWENATGTIAYDNQPLAADGANPVTALGGGSISIQTNGGSAAGDMTIASDEASTATRYALLQNSPNPFNPETVISYETAGRSAVHIRVFDISGRLVATLVDGELEAGRHTATWNGRTSTGAPASSGTYFVLMDAGTHRDKRAIVLLK
jgi:hypothetical protein